MDSVGIPDSDGLNSLQIRLITVVAIAYAQCAIDTAVIPIVLPALKCDFALDSGTAGFLTSLPLIGNAIGSLWWGLFADVFGRKSAIFISMLVAGVAGILSSVSMDYCAFVFLRTINNFGLSGILALIFSYLSENLPNSKKDVILSCTEFWYTLGMMVVPILSWLVIPMTINYEDAYFRFYSWNLMVLISGVLQLACALLFGGLPETTEFLRERRENVLFKKASTFFDNFQSIMKASRMLWEQCQLLFTEEHRKSTIICGIFSFFINLTYITIAAWLPDIVTRFRAYEEIHSGQDGTLCQMTSVYAINANATENSCSEGYSDDAFLSNMATALVCLPTSVILAIFGKKIGFRFFVIFPQTVCCVGIASLLFLKSSISIMSISWIFVSFISITIEATWISLVDIFPLQIRAAGAGFAESVGKIGGLVGTLAFGYLIDLYCLIPVLTFILLLAGSTVLSSFLPIGKKNVEKRRINLQIQSQVLQSPEVS